MNPTEMCVLCGHSMMTHSNEGCWHHDLGVICGCMILPPPGTRKPGGRTVSAEVLDLIGMSVKERRPRWVAIADRIPDDERKQDVATVIDFNAKGSMVDDTLRLLVAWLEGYECKVAELEEKLRVQTERAERLDKENNARFSKETEYQNRIRALEQRLRDVASYAARDLPQR